jgi:LytR cell envelope-related transcriptional attenuator
MEIIQEIGSYAGFAAVLGLAVLSALYFSQARDVKRLREWAGRAPDRETQPAVPQQRVVAQPVPRPPAAVQRPGVPASPATAVGPGLAPATPAAGSAAAAAAAGAAPATAAGPVAPASPGDAGVDEDQDSEETDAVDAGSNGTDDHAALSQDTVVHPPPPPTGDEDEEDEDTGEHDVPATGDDDDDDDEDYPEDAPERHWEDTGDEPAVTPPTLPPRRPTIPIGSAGAATPAGQAARAAPSTGGSGGILPPYEQSRPGGRAKDPVGGGRFSGSPRRAVGLMAAGLAAVAVIGFGIIQLTGGDDSKKAKAPTKSSGSSGDAKSKKSTAKKKKAGIDPSKVRVAVLNGTTVPGLAANVGDEIEKQGFQLGTITNFVDQQRAESVVLYAPGAEREAADVGKRLKIAQREPIDAESQSVAGDATVVVVTGADKTQ